MSCLKGKNLTGKKSARYSCEKCGALVEKKGQICKPQKLEGKGKKGK